MHSTVSTITRAVAAADLQEPIIPVHSNVTSHQYRTIDSIRSQLVNQLWKPIRWEQTMHVLYGRRVGSDFPLTFEVGPGKQLGFILQHVNAKAYSQYDNIHVWPVLQLWYVVTSLTQGCPVLASAVRIVFFSFLIESNSWAIIWNFESNWIVGCGFVVRSKLPAIIATAIQLSYLKLNSFERTSSEQLK